MKRMVEVQTGVFSEPRHRYLHHGTPKIGDMVMHSELLDDGTWTEWKTVKVVAG